MFKRVVLGVVMAASCSTPDRDSAQGSTAGGTSSPVAAAADSIAIAGSPASGESAAGQEIYIDSVRGSNPLTVFGRARTFENTVQVRVRDDAGRLIAERFTTSNGEMGSHNPFALEMWLVRAPGSRVVIEAFEYSARDGPVRSLTRETIPYRTPTTPLALVFPTSDCTVMGTFTRNAPRAVAIARLLVEALVEGPTNAEQASGARSPFPRGSAVNSVILHGGEITVDFNERLQNVGGSCAAQGIRAAVTQTLSRLPGVSNVVITAGGSRELALQP